MIIYNILLFLYAGLLIYWGTKSAPGFASWHMFANLNMMKFDLYFKSHSKPNDNWVKLEVFDYLPHTHLSMSTSELKWFLVYLGKVKNLEIKGTCTHYFHEQESLIKVERNRIQND